MILPNIKAIGIASGVGLLVGSLSTWYLTTEYKDAVWGAATNQIQIEAAEQLHVATMKAIETERISQLKVHELEAQHAQEEHTIQTIERRNRALAAQLGGLRDPGRRTSGTDTMPSTTTSTTSVTDSPTHSILSGEATEVLLATSVEVDKLANYAKVCYDYVQVLTGVSR